MTVIESRHVEKPFVLVVDDNEATCTLITALLDRDFEIETAADGDDAIDQLRTKNYAAILLDLRIPRVDGFAVLDFVRDQKPDDLRRILVLTAALTKAEIARVKSYKICGIVAKPFEVETLLAAVKQCVDPDAPPSGRFIASGVILLLAEVLR
jgi:CheY-like chemotaxis protein